MFPKQSPMNIKIIIIIKWLFFQTFQYEVIRQVGKRNLNENRLDDLPHELIKQNKISQQQQKTS